MIVFVCVTVKVTVKFSTFVLLNACPDIFQKINRCSQVSIVVQNYVPDYHARIVFCYFQGQGHIEGSYCVI